MNRLRFSKDQRYIYSVGRIRVLERYLLTVTDLERLIESESFSASIRHLAESRAYEHFGGKEDLAGIETLLLAEQEKNSNLAGEMAIQKALKDVISLEAGVFDRVKLETVYETVRASRLDFLAEYLSRRIDWLNIILFFRMREYIRREGLLKDNLISYGLIPSSLYLKLYEIPAQDFLSELSRYGYSLRSLNPLSQVEKQADDYLIRFLKPAKYEGFGYEPIFGYLVGKERELRNLRIILFGKFYNLSNATIRENIREPYV